MKVTPCKAEIDEKKSSIDGPNILKEGDTQPYTAMIAAKCGRCVVEQEGGTDEVQCKEVLEYQWFYQSQGGHVSIEQDMKDQTKNRAVDVKGKTAGAVVLEVSVRLKCESRNSDCKDSTVGHVRLNINVK